MANINLKTKTKSKQSDKDLAKKNASNGGAEYSFRLIITIVERGNADDIVEALSNDYGVKFHIECQGDGTADSAILQLFNLDKSLKDVVICVVEAAKCPQVLQAINNIYHGSGIAFSIKLDSIGGRRALKLLKGDFDNIKTETTTTMKKE